MHNPRQNIKDTLEEIFASHNTCKREFAYIERASTNK